MDDYKSKVNRRKGNVERKGQMRIVDCRSLNETEKFCMMTVRLIFKQKAHEKKVVDIHMDKFTRIPKHIGIIPDGNRRWAEGEGLAKQEGYTHGIDPGLQLYEACLALGVEEVTFYGFTMDNTKRPSIQKMAFQKACTDSVNALKKRDADLLVIGNEESSVFPEELKPYRTRKRFGEGKMKVNFLVNYGWNWDLKHAMNDADAQNGGNILPYLASKDISRMDLIIRWGGRTRLSGFLPVQSVYSDIYVIDTLWPDYEDAQFMDAIRWYQDQDVTLGG